MNMQIFQLILLGDFLLSLYLDKANWFERIAQGKSIGFVIILVGLLGLAFSIFRDTEA